MIEPFDTILHIT